MTQNPALRIGLHLQGGAVFGAWQEGALQNIFARPDLFDIRYVSGTSAGAMNAAVITQAINAAPSRADGYERAGANLSALWDDVRVNGATHAASFQTAQSVLERTGLVREASWPNLPILEEMARCARLTSSFENAMRAGLSWMPLAGFFARAVVPDVMGHVRYAATETLRGVITKHVRVDDGGKLLRTDGSVHLYVNAAERHAGGYTDRVFGPDDVTLDVLMASGAVEGQFEPVRINGKTYVDGAHTANPSFAPLDRHSGDVDAVITIASNAPRETALCPMPQAAIARADLDKSHNFVLHQMFRELAQRAEATDGPTHHVIAHMHPHHWDWTAKQNTDPRFIDSLRAQGRVDGAAQLTQQFAHMGRQSTVSKDTLEAMAHPAHTGGLVLPAPRVRAA